MRRVFKRFVLLRGKLKVMWSIFFYSSMFRDELANIENRILEKKIAEKKKEELRKKNIAVRSVNRFIMFWPTICLPLDVWRLQESPEVLSTRFRCWGGGGTTSKSKTCRRWQQTSDSFFSTPSKSTFKLGNNLPRRYGAFPPELASMPLGKFNTYFQRLSI